MSKVSRTFRIENELSRALTLICERHGDATWHIEKALAAYAPIKKQLKKEAPKAKEVVVQSIPATINPTAWAEWLAARKPSKGAITKQHNLLAMYDFATQQVIIDASINSGWQGLFAPKGVVKPVSDNFIGKHSNDDWAAGL